MKGKRVLIVHPEDSFSRELIAALVGEEYTVETAVDANQATLKLNHSLPDMLLLATRMPGGNGAALHQFVTRQNAALPVIYLAEANTPDAVTAARRNGAADVLIKPLDMSTAMDTIELYLRSPEERARMLRGSNTLRLLAVEDDKDHQETIAEALSKPGREDIEITYASTVREAGDKIKNDEFDCILLDHNLPDGTGADVLDENEGRLWTTMVLGLSTSADPEVALADFRGGATEFVQKRLAFADGLLRRRLFESFARFKQRATASVVASRRRSSGVTISDEELIVAARTDRLMGVFNRAAFEEYHAACHQRASKRKKRYALCLADVDNFKKYNDHYGHAAGDTVLRAVAQAMRGALRGSDFIARYGGEEIVLILEEFEDTDVLQIAQRVCSAVSGLNLPHELNSTYGKVTISLGAALFDPASNETAGDIVVRADGALYEVKAGGRNTARIAPEPAPNWSIAMQGEKPISLLVVEDSEDHRELIAERLGGDHPSFSITFTETCSAAAQALAGSMFDCVLLDHNLPDGTGATLLSGARFQLMTTPVVAISTSRDPSIALEDMLQGSATFLSKNDAFVSNNLRNVILETIENHQVLRRIERAKTRPDLLGQAASLLDGSNHEPANATGKADYRLRQLYEAAVQTIDEGIILIENGRRIVFANDGFRKLLRLSSVDDLPGHPSTTIEDVFDKRSVNMIRRRGDRGPRFEVMLAFPNSPCVPVMIAETRLSQQGVLCAVTDLRDIKDRENKLEEANRRLRASFDRLRENNHRLRELTDTAHRFVDDVAHEFRTPLAVILGFSSIITDGLSGPISPEQTEYLGFISSASRDLSQMVDDFLDSSKLKAGTLRVDRRQHEVSAIFNSIRPMIESRASMKGIAVKENIEAGLPAVLADGEKVGRAVINLVINAVKFSPEKHHIVLSARREGSDQIRISVEDFGPGMESEDVALIGQRFQQANNPMLNSSKGFGLGLCIAKELAWLNLGSFNVQSEPRRGSTFSFTVLVFDPAIIFKHYLANMQSEEPGAGGSAIVASHKSMKAAALREFLASVCHPMDLLLATADETRVIAISGTSAPDRWIARLSSAWESHCKRDNRSDTAALTFRVVAQGGAAVVDRAALEEFKNVVAQEKGRPNNDAQKNIGNRR